ncbi:unnamed protein product [Aphanomyces euteiches]
MAVRGTKVLTSVDSESGETYVAVAAGTVSAKTNNEESPDPSKNDEILIAPSQQLSLDSREEVSDLETKVGIIDPKDLVGGTSSEIIEAIVKDKADIDRENAEFIAAQKEKLDKGDPTGISRGGADSSLNPKDQSELDKIAKNLDNLIGNVVNTALEEKKVDKDKIDKIIEDINKDITDPNKKLDLSKVEPLDKTAGVDPALQKAKDAELKKLADAKKAADDAKKAAEAAAKLKLAEALKKLEEEKARIAKEKEALGLNKATPTPKPATIVIPVVVPNTNTGGGGSTPAPTLASPIPIAVRATQKEIIYAAVLPKTADTDNHAIRVIDKTGAVTILAGNGVQGNVDAKGKEAKFNHPTDLAVAKDGTVYVADTLNNTIRKITADGTVTTLNAVSDRKVLIASGQTIAAGDYKDGALAQAKFNDPSGIAIDAKGNLYVSDTGNQKIRYIDLTSNQVTTVAGSGAYEAALANVVGDYADGDAAKAIFNNPLGITVTDEGGLLIADSLNNSIRYLFNGKVSTIAGDIDQFAGETNGVERSARFSVPTDVAVAADGTILVADSFNNKIRSIKPYQLPADLAKDASIKVVYNNKSVVLDSKAEIKDSRTMVPFRAIAEALGYEVKYTAEGQIIEMTKGSVTIKMVIGAKTVTTIEKGKDDVVTKIDVAPYIIDNRTLIPVRFFAEQIGLDVQWNSKNHTAILRNKTN